MFPSRTFPSSINLPEVSVCAVIGTTIGRVEDVCVIGATNVLGEVLLAELYCRITQGRSLHSSLPTPIPKLQRYTCPRYIMRFLAEGAIAFRYNLFLSHSRYCCVFGQYSY